MLLDGKTMVVTGGNSGIGEAIVKAAAAQGANVVIDYVAHPEETETLIASIEALGGRAVGVQADVSQAADLHKMVRTAVDAFGRLDALATTPASRRAPRSSTPPRRTTSASWTST